MKINIISHPDLMVVNGRNYRPLTAKEANVWLTWRSDSEVAFDVRPVLVNGRWCYDEGLSKVAGGSDGDTSG